MKFERKINAVDIIRSQQYLNNVGSINAIFINEY